MESSPRMARRILHPRGSAARDGRLTTARLTPTRNTAARALTQSTMESCGTERSPENIDSETRAAFTALNETVTALSGKVAALDQKVTGGFARADRYFELQHQQHLELRARLDALTHRVALVEREVAQLRDYVTREIGEVRAELRDLRSRSDQTDEIRREIAELTVRVDRLERRQSD